MDVTKEEMKEKLEKSDFVGIIIKETLNCTLDKKLIVYARVENNSVVETIFLGNYTIDNRTAECVFEMLVKVLERQIDGWLIFNAQPTMTVISGRNSLSE